MKELEDRIRKIIQPIFERLGYYLVGVQLRGGRNNMVLTVYADTEPGITMQQITELTREIEDVMDINDPIRGRYRLEVSSPGLSRPLTEQWQFRKNVGRQLRVLFETGEGRKDYIGVLSGVDEEGILLKLKKEEINIPLVKIVKAEVKPAW